MMWKRGSESAQVFLGWRQATVTGPATPSWIRMLDLILSSASEEVIGIHSHKYHSFLGSSTCELIVQHGERDTYGVSKPH